ncbi:MAG TPA: hypothetical protein VL463_19115 [Kofleriaceae bacterium]|jgi:hypothetical protein|nr:hypothetical protein [Kofleriaceae bacterium]
MADDDKERQQLAAQEKLDETSDEKKLFLEQGRSVTVNREGANQVVEFRDAGGQLELRVKMTEEGPVLVMEGMKVQVNAAESFSVKCKEFNVEAEGETIIATKGELKIKSDGEMSIDSPDDIRVRGKIIYLN